VSKRGDRWYISIQTEIELSAPIHPSSSSIGIDMGVVRFATMSDGTVIEPLSAYRRLERKLRWEQRKLARMVKFSRNWHGQKARIQRLYAHIACVRADQLHKVSTSICKNHATVVVEDLKVRRLTASANGTTKSSNKGTKARASLNKAILDQGWFSFRLMLDYKLLWRGGRLVVVDPRNTSQRCAQCDLVSPENRKTQAEFTCIGCGHRSHADLNAAINVLRAGHALIACSSA
jgi:putative transposase